MKTTVTLNAFREAFVDVSHNFSYEGLEVLFNHINELEKKIGVEIELNANFLYYDYLEETIHDAYVVSDIILCDKNDDEEKREAVISMLKRREAFVGETSTGNVIYKHWFNS